MTWTDILKHEVESAYRSARGLMQLAEGEDLNWKPAQGENWMTMGELLLHMTSSCGWCTEAFLTGKWEAPKDGKKTVASVKEAVALLDADKALALASIKKAGEARLDKEMVRAPWGIEGTFGQQFLDMVKHLSIHKAQLFYYLKLRGKPVHTGHMWGMEL